MRPTPDQPVAALLLDALEALSVVIDDAGCQVRDVAVPSYPDGLRPSAILTLTGGGLAGRGEHVAWTGEDHERFRVHVGAAVPRGRWRLGAWASRVARATPWPYARAALEAAAIDLALRQAHTSLGRLIGVTPRPVEFVVSFDRRPDPVAEVCRQRARTPTLRFKIDADPGWSPGIYEALGSLDAVATLDFKGSGTADDHELAHRLVPDAFIEDPAFAAAPWSTSFRSRVSFDAPVLAAADLAQLPVHPAAVNIKPARMGGVLEALRCVAACARGGIPTYFGGMFEVGVGRSQLWTLASLLAPSAPNDVAPIPTGFPGACTPPLPAAIDVDDTQAGFGVTTGGA